MLSILDLVLELLNAILKTLRIFFGLASLIKRKLNWPLVIAIKFLRRILTF